MEVIVLITYVLRPCLGIASNQQQRSNGDRPETEVVQYEAHHYSSCGNGDCGGDVGG